MTDSSVTSNEIAPVCPGCLQSRNAARDRDRAESMVERLRAALERYGHHIHPNCHDLTLKADGSFGPRNGCLCGFDTVSGDSSSPEATTPGPRVQASAQRAGSADASRESVVETAPKPADTYPNPMGWLGFPAGPTPKHDFVYDGATRLPGYVYKPIFTPPNHPSAEETEARYCPNCGERTDTYPDGTYHKCANATSAPAETFRQGIDRIRPELREIERRGNCPTPEQTRAYAMAHDDPDLYNSVGKTSANSDPGVTHPDCNYLAPTGGPCTKCGWFPENGKDDGV